MIERKIGNMLEEVSNGFMVQGCNAQGVMGGGIALSIKNMYPEAYRQYRDKWEHGSYLVFPGETDHKHIQELEMGTIIPVQVTHNAIMVNAITQRFFTSHPYSNGGREVDYEAVAKAFELINELPSLYEDVDPILNFPLVGAGLAKGNWDIVASIIDETVTHMDKVLWVLP